MSLLFFDGFDGFDAAADLTANGGWYSQSGISSLSSTVRTGTGKSLALSANGYVTKQLSDQAAKTLYFGFSFRRSGTPSVNSPIFAVYNTAAWALQCCISINTTNKLEVRRGNAAGTLLATGSTTLSDGVWYYIEAKILVHSSAGIFDVKIDSTSEISFSGNTQNAANNSVLAFALGNQNSVGQGSPACNIDDFYLLNSDGSANNTYLGEQRCEIITPTSDSSVAWTRNTGASNYLAVDDAIGAPDDDTTYVSSSTATQKDEYGLSDLTGINTVAGVKVNTRAKKDDANARSFKHGIKSGSTNQQVTYSLGVGYANYIDIFETSDGAGTAFTQTTVNSLLSTIECV